MPRNKSKFKAILAYRNANDSNIHIVKGDDDNSNIHEAFKSFMLTNFGITNFYQQLIYGRHDGTVRSFIVEYLDNDQPYTLYSGMYKKTAGYNDGETEIEQLSDIDLIDFIYALVLQGYLSPKDEVLDYRGLSLATMPMVLLTHMNSSPKEDGECNGDYFIKRLATNDPLLIDINQYVSSEDTHKSWSYSQTVHADDAIERMISHGTFDRDARYPDAEPLHNGMGYTVTLKGSCKSSHEREAAFKELSNLSTNKNSLFLSPQFLDLFKEESGRTFSFEQRILSSINGSTMTQWGVFDDKNCNDNFLHAPTYSLNGFGDSSDILPCIKDLVSKDNSDNSLEKMFCKALNSYFFDREQSSNITYKKEKVVTDGLNIIPVQTHENEQHAYACSNVNLGKVLVTVVNENMNGRMIELTLCSLENKKVVDWELDDSYSVVTGTTYSITSSSGTRDSTEFEPFNIYKDENLSRTINRMISIIMENAAQNDGVINIMPFIRNSFAAFGNEHLLTLDISDL